MTLYTAVLYIHVVSALGIFAVLSFEAATLRRLRSSTDSRDARIWLGYSPDLTAWTLTAFIFMLFSGIYLTSGMSGWGLAWPRVAIGSLFLIAPLGGIANRKMRAIKLVCGTDHPDDSAVLAKLRDPFLRLSINLRIALVLGIVLLMAAKPGLLESLGVIGAAAILGFASTYAFWRGDSVSPMARAESRQ